MGFSTIILVILVIFLGICSFVLLQLNETIVRLDLLFLELDFQLGYVILFSTLLGILIAISLEIIYFYSKKENKDE